MHKVRAVSGGTVKVRASGGRGVPGVPGVNAIPADDFIAGRVADPGSATATALSAAIAVKSPVTGFVMDLPTETSTTTAVVPTGSLAGVAYGRKADGGAGLYKSTDDGTTWTLVTSSVTPYSGIHALGNGEVLVNQGGTLKKSTGWAANPTTATWATVATANGTSSFIESNVDTYANLVIAAEYAVPRTDARYVKVSTDNGATFTNVRDLNTLFPDDTAQTHWHAVAIDPWHTGPNPRLWTSHGDGPRGVYYSDDLGATWTEYGTTNTWQPMPMMATEHGIVTSTDQPNPDGVWLIPRDLSARVLLARVPKPFWQGSLLGFGIGAVRDEATGVVYITFRADQQTYFTESNKALIFATDGQRASIIYETLQGGTVGVSGSTNFEGRPALTADGYLLATYNTGTSTKRIVKGKVRRGSKAAAIADKGNVLTGVANDRTSVAVGYGTKARNRSIVIGALAGADMSDTDETAVLIGEESVGSNRATAVGFQAQALLTHSVAVGYTAAATGAESVGIGSQVIASGTTSTAVGRSAQATGVNAVAVGKDARATAQGAIAFGASSRASSQGALAIGEGVAKGGYAPVAVGDYMTSANGASAVAVGEGARVDNAGAAVAYGVAIGGGALAKAQAALALGRQADAQGTESVALGAGTVTPGSYSVGIGYRNLEVTKYQSGTDVNAPGANKVRIYLRDNGAGKMQFCARFPTGAVQVIATEP